MFETRPTINRDYLIEKIGEESIFYKYLGIWPELSKRFTNKLRGDESPDCFFYVKNNRLYFKDFAGGYHWDCFNVVEYQYKCSFSEALQIIAKDFGLSKSTKEYNIVKVDKIDKSKEKEYPELHGRIKKKWSIGEIDFWKEHFVDGKTIQQYQVYALSEGWINGKQVFGYRTDRDIGFLYVIKNGNITGKKFYFPFRSRSQGKFFHDYSFLLQGYNQLPEFGEVLIITKSLKDVIVLATFGIPAIAPMAESILMSYDQIMELKHRFETIYTLFDFDRAGRALAQKMKQLYAIPYLFFTNGELGLYNFNGIKDFAEHNKKRGYQETIDVIQRIKILYNL